MNNSGKGSRRTVSFIGDIHYILGAKEFRDRLDEVDVIFLEYPDEYIQNKSRVKEFWRGLKNSYAHGGFFKLLLFPFLYMRCFLFARSTLVSEVTTKEKYLNKVVGIDDPEKRQVHFEDSGKVGFRGFLVLFVVMVLLPRSFVKALWELLVVKKGDTSEEGRLYADEMDSIVGSDSDVSDSHEGREVKMAEKIRSYLEDNPDVSDVAVIVGMAHLESVIELVDEDGLNVKIENSNIVSDYLESEL